jgi:hypothetical protein
MTEPLNVLAPMRVVAIDPRCADPALDMTEKELEAYRRTRDFSLLKFKTGMRPRVFTVQRLDAMRVVNLATLTDGPPRETAAFLAACHAIEMPDGKPLAPADNEYVDLGDGERTTDVAWMKRAARAVSLYAVWEIGYVALRWAALPEDAQGPF